MGAARILVVDDDRLLRTIITERLERSGYDVTAAGTLTDARAALHRYTPDVALLDVKLPDGEGPELLAELAADGETACIMMTAHATVEAAVAAVQQGAWDYLEKPFSLDKLEATLVSTLERTALQRELRALREKSSIGGTVVGASPAMKEVMALVERVAPAGTSTVLIEGETGTGKGVIAGAIHRLSPRANGPFVNVTCSALAESLMESELFGHEKGAFTDARTMKRGLVEIADGGTLFLDEIGELSLAVQAKLLRFIEDKTFRRVGGTRDLTVDVRVVAATNRDLESAVRDGSFRDDLYYRLKVLPIRMPPLRERKSDIPALAKTFLGTFNREFGKRIREISPEAMDILARHPWPGNVRELRNVMERAVLLADGPIITPEMLPASIRGGPVPASAGAASMFGSEGLDLEELERNLLVEALRRAEGNRTQAGRLLGLSRHQIRNRLQKFGLDE
jgi:two-component system response regulator AtoC